MKTAGLLCALAALTGCSEGQGPSDAETKQARSAAAGGLLEPGTYEYSSSDGAAGLIMLTEDGTYSDAMSGGNLETGAWQQDESRGCFVPAGDAAGRCYRFTKPDTQGRFTGTATDGSTMTARKLE